MSTPAVTTPSRIGPATSVSPSGEPRTSARSAARLDPALRDLVGRLSLPRKVQLLTGATAWRLHALDEIGLRGMVVSDGPVGVRGTSEDLAETSVLLPAPSALAATWDVALASRVGTLFAGEARRHGVDVVLAPQANIQRTPVAGRHFECYSEDPLLTTQIAGSLVGAVQDAGVAACLKHFVANDSETDRTVYVSEVDERTLREVYLAPFEHAVREVGVWSVMAAYNQVDDGVLAAPATEHSRLLRDVLKHEWGFDGPVVSDWLAARRTVESADGGLDLVMPGPGGPWEAALVRAVEEGAVDEAVVDDKVLRLLRLATHVGALPALADQVQAPPVDPTLPREVAARGTVVLRDVGRRLPVDPATVRRVALIGPNAVRPYVQGGGSAHLRPDAVVTPTEGLRAALPHAEITLLRGGDNRRHPDPLDLGRCTDPRTGAPGLRVSLLDTDGAELATEVRTSWDGWCRDLPGAVHDVRVEALVALPETGRHHLELGTVGRWELTVDGRPVGRGTRTVGAEVVLDSSINHPPGCGLEVEAGEAHLVATVQSVRNEGYGNQARAALRHRLPGPGTDAEIAAAVDAAQTADLVVVVVGTTEEVESEGWDRDSLALPGRQDDLVEAVLTVAPDAVVVVNAGAPVLLPWLERARTVLWTWLPGQDGGHALADVLLGVTEPSGRLPWTLPASAEDVPVPHAVPQDGRLRYTEGVHVGYREWLRRGTRPAAPFGHGLGWTTWRYHSLAVAPTLAPGADLELTVSVTNTGPRAGREVVQVYLEPPDADRAVDRVAPGAAGAPLPERPVRWLAGFAVVVAEADARASTTVRVPARALQVWDVATATWTTPPGTYRVRVGRSVADLRLGTHVTVPSPDPGEVPHS